MNDTSFLSRLPESETEGREIVDRAFRIVDTLSAKVKDIRGNQHLTKIGQDEQIKQVAKGGLAEDLRHVHCTRRIRK